MKNAKAGAGYLFIATLFALLCLSSSMPAQKLRKLENKSFREGEKLSYTINYGFIKGGVFDLEIKPSLVTIRGRKCYHISAVGKTVGTVDWFFKVRDYYQSFLDTEAILPHRFLRNVTEGKYKKVENVEFDHQKNIAVNNGRDTVKMGEDFQDILSAYYYSRCLDVTKLKVGDIIPIYAYLDAAVTPFHLKYAGKEVVETRMGRFRCLIFKPQLQLGRVFSEEEGMTIWVSDDDNHIPVMLEAKLLVGAIRMNLVSYQGLANPATSRVE
jgi:hypothetical protein